MTDSPVTLTDGSGVVRFEGTQSPGGGSQPGALCSADLLFTEEATAGTYTAPLDVEAGTAVVDVLVYLLGWPWGLDPNNDALHLTIGDDANPAGWYDLQLLNGSYAQYNPANPDFSSWFSAAGPATGGTTYQSTTYGTDAAGNAAAGPGVRYSGPGTVTAQIETTITAPPVTPSGILLAKVLYFAPVTAVAAVFA